MGNSSISDQDGRLQRLQRAIESTSGTAQGKVHCHRDHGDLVIDVANEPVGRWRSDGDGFVFYRPGSDLAETLASSLANAARLSARLIAAADQT